MRVMMPSVEPSTNTPFVEVDGASAVLQCLKPVDLGRGFILPETRVTSTGSTMDVSLGKFMVAVFAVVWVVLGMKFA